MCCVCKISTVVKISDYCTNQKVPGSVPGELVEGSTLGRDIKLLPVGLVSQLYANAGDVLRAVLSLSNSKVLSCATLVK